MARTTVGKLKVKAIGSGFDTTGASLDELAKAAPPSVWTSETDRKLESAARAVVANLTAAAQPFIRKKSPRHLDEPVMREFAHATRQLLPLFDALALSMRRPDYTKYKYGYLLRFVEEILEVAQFMGDEYLQQVSPREGATGGRKAAPILQAKADARWRVEARKIVGSILAKDTRRWKKSGLIGEIMKRWTGKPAALPGYKSISRLINEMLSKGEIPSDRILRRGEISLDT